GLAARLRGARAAPARVGSLPCALVWWKSQADEEFDTPQVLVDALPLDGSGRGQADNPRPRQGALGHQRADAHLRLRDAVDTRHGDPASSQREIGGGGDPQGGRADRTWDSAPRGVPAPARL